MRPSGSSRRRVTSHLASQNPEWNRLVGPAFLLLATSAYTPLTLLAGNLKQAGRGYRLLILALVIFIVLALASLLLGRVVGATYKWMNSLALAWLIQSIAAPLGTYKGLALVIVASLVGYRLSGWGVFDGLVIVLAVALGGGPSLQILQTHFGTSSTLAIDTHTPAESLRPEPPAPDAWLVVLDGFASATTFEENFGLSMPLRGVLEKHGFETNLNSLSPYPFTHLVLPSLLQASPVAEDGFELNPSGWEALKRISGGENRLVSSFEEIGYTIRHVENGWHLSACGEGIDICVPAPLIDDQVATVISRSLIGRMIGLAGDDAFVLGARHVMDQGLEWARTSLPTPSLTILHLLIPHPPFGFDAACHQQSLEGDRIGLWFVLPGVTESLRSRRIQLYHQQAACAAAWLDRLLTALGAGGIVGVVGDHGTDSLGQLFIEPRSWDTDMLRERYSTVAAFRGSEGCSSDLQWVTGVTRAMIECVTGTRIETESHEAYLVIAGKRYNEVESLDAEGMSSLRLSVSGSSKDGSP